MMDFIQKIKLKDVVANNDAILFKVNVNGEDRIFIGKQNTKFDIDVADNLESHLLSDKLSSNLKLSESFQKAYLIDRDVMHKENLKKDVIVPCAVSKDIVQLGNLLYSMSTETNNNVLYLLYKNRLINRYVDDATNIIYYELNDAIKEIIDDLRPNEILQGADSPIDGFKGLIDNFNMQIIDKSDNDEEKTRLTPIEKIAYYKKMEGFIEGLEDFSNVNVKTGSVEKENEMPFNMIYEYGEDRQYENEQSNIYTDFIHLKNSLSPFFNVEVTNDEENSFKLWRKYEKINSSNFKLWTSYSLETPKTINYEKNNNVSTLNVGNNFPGITPATDYYNSVKSFIKTQIDYRLDDNLTNEGFTIHVDCPRDQIISRFMFSFNNRAAANKNSDYSHLTKTTQDFANWLIEKSDGKIQFKHSSGSSLSYPEYTEFTINIISVLDSNDTIIELECLKDLDRTDISIIDELESMIPPFVNVFDFNYDKGQIYRKGFDAFQDFKSNELQYKPNGKDKIIEYAELVYGEYVSKSIVGNVYNWTNLDNNIADNYKADSFILHYKDGNLDEFSKKNIYNYNKPEYSKSVNTKDFVKKISWSMSLINAEEQFNWIKDALYNIGHKVEMTHGYYYEKLSDEEWTTLLNADYNKDTIINAEINIDGYGSIDAWNKLDTEVKIKYLLTKLIGNYDSFHEFNSTTILDGENFQDIKNVFLCEAVGTTLEDAVSCLFYYINKNGMWKAGDKIRFTNYRLSQFETRLFEDDHIYDEKYYYLTSDSGPSVKYFSTPFDIRPAIKDDNYSDEPLSGPNYDSSIIDLFGITINGRFVNNYEIMESNIVSYLLRDKSSSFSIDLSVSFKNKYLEDALCINSYINGQLVNSSEYQIGSQEYSELLNKLGTLNDIRFWCYGENGYTNSEFTGVSPFIFTNISMWNIPLNIIQCQLLRRMALAKKSLDDYVNDFYKLDDNGLFEIVSSDTDEINLYGKLFSINSYKLVYEYLFNNTEGVSVNDKKLFKIQDFEFVDRINSLNKLTPTSGRKSNLYSVKISNTGLAIEDDDDDETRYFKQTMNSALVSAVNTICSKTEPLNTKLYSVIIDS